MNQSHNKEAAAIKRHYWLRESFNHLMGLVAELTPARIRDPGFSIVYPKTTLGVCCELQIRGLNASVPALHDLIGRKIVGPPQTGEEYQWLPEQIDLAAEYFNHRQAWTSTARFCRAANLEFGQVVRAYRVAVARYGLPFVSDFDVRNVVTAIEPASQTHQYSRIRFYQRNVSLEPDGEPEVSA